MEPVDADFPFIRAVIRVTCKRTVNGRSSKTVSRYYVSSLPASRLTPAQWLQYILGHWGGVENRNHWRKDACLGEDRTPSRKPGIVGSLAMIRNMIFPFYDRHRENYPTITAFTEAVAADSGMVTKLITNPLWR